MFRSLRFWISAAIGVLLLTLFLVTTDPGEIGRALRDMKYWYVPPALAVFALGHWLRSWRWSLLMRPVAAVPTRRLFSYFIVGAMANNLLPARTGELVRAYVLGQRERIPTTGVLGTIAVERLFDGCTLVLMLLVAGAFTGLDEPGLRVIAIVAAALFAVAFAVFYWLTLVERRVHRAAAFVLDRLPAGPRQRVEPHLRSFIDGLRSVHDWRRFLSVACFSAVSWIVEACAYVVLGPAFGIDIGFAHYVLLLAAANLAIVVPTLLGGAGPFEWAVRLVLVNAGVASGLAGAYAIGAHFILLVPVTVAGLLLLWAFGIPIGSLGRLGRARDAPDAEREAVVP